MSVPQGGHRLLLIDGHEPTREDVRLVMEVEGFEVHALPDGAEARMVAEALRPDLVVLETTLPRGPDGFQVARALRDHDTRLAVVFLTAADELEERLAGFRAGADDYVVKPFLMEELLARLRAVLRRCHPEVPREHRVGQLRVDEAARTVRWRNLPIDLTAIEFELLVTMIRHRGQVLSTDELLSRVWGDRDRDDNVVQARVSALRRKLTQRTELTIETVRGIGYVVR